LAANPVPIQQDQGQHAPDGDVVEAGVAKDALAERVRVLEAQLAQAKPEAARIDPYDRDEERLTTPQPLRKVPLGRKVART